MVSINIHSATHHRDATTPLGSHIAAKLRTVLNAAIPVVIMGLVLVGLLAFRFWATFPAIHEIVHN
jgi:hypothetical protein